MSRWSDHAWREDLEDWRTESVIDWIEHGSFWSYVDSQPNAASHSGECATLHHPYFGTRVDCWDWAHVRGDDCLGRRSDLTRCAERTLGFVPFCAKHFDSVWRAVAAFVTKDRGEAHVRRVTSDYQFELMCADIDIAMVWDARRLMEKQDERVYFFAAGGAVKIGRSINPAKRVRTLGATKAPEGVDVSAGVLLGTIPGGCRVESALHLRFRPHRLVGEWFDLPAIREQVDAILAEYVEAGAA